MAGPTPAPAQANPGPELAGGSVGRGFQNRLSVGSDSLFGNMP